jgi:rubredoxin
MNTNSETLADDTSARKVMVVLECPKCHWIFKTERPDDLHPTSSFEKPQSRSVISDVIKKNHVCRNPKCKNAFLIYWFETDHLKRI